MASINKVILVGNLGRDPEMRYTPDGLAICTISIATTSSWKDKNSGEKKEETEWHRVVLYNRLGEVAGQYLKKGSAVYIEGRLKTRKWQDKDSGQDRYATDIIADQMQMLGGKSSAPAYEDGGYDDGGFSNMPSTPQPARSAPARAAAPAAAVAPSFANIDDDIPF